MFEQDKNILGQKAEYDLGLDQKDKKLSKYKIDLYKLSVFVIEDSLFINQDDFDNLLGDNFLKEIFFQNLAKVTNDMINYILKNNSNLVIEYIKK